MSFDPDWGEFLPEDGKLKSAVWYVVGAVGLVLLLAVCCFVWLRAFG